jgi:hypothetical protein
MTPVFEFDLDSTSEAGENNKPKVDAILTITTASRASLIELAEDILRQVRYDSKNYSVTIGGKLTKWDDDDTEASGAA